MIYIANAFSLGMVAPADLHRVRFAPCSRPEPTLAAGRCTSAVGHADTAALLGVPMNRISVKLAVGDWMYVAQLQGPRLPEGTTVLPEGSEFSWVGDWMYVAQLQGPRLPEGTTVLPEGSEFSWVSVSLAADGETA